MLFTFNELYSATSELAKKVPLVKTTQSRTDQRVTYTFEHVTVAFEPGVTLNSPDVVMTVTINKDGERLFTAEAHLNNAGFVSPKTVGDIASSTFIGLPLSEYVNIRQRSAIAEYILLLFKLLKGTVK